MDDVTNAGRAAWALEAVSGFVADTCVDTATDAISDLIANLLHLARGRGINPELIAARSLATMNAEVIEDDEGDMANVQLAFRSLIGDDA
jgi:phage terminase small subunit